MNGRDFDDVAKIIKEARIRPVDRQLEFVMHEFSRLAAKDNPRFSEGIFFRACGQVGTSTGRISVGKTEAHNRKLNMRYLEEAHLQDLHDEVPREGCPMCERKT